MTPLTRTLVASAFLAIAGCASQTTMETRQVTEASPVDARRRAEVHTALAAEYYQRGNFPVALAETRRAIAEDSTYAPAHNVQGLVYMELREDGPAREAFARALSISPSNPDVLNNYGWFLCLRNETERGMELLLRAASDNLYSTPEKAYLSAGLCMRRAGRMADAENYLRRAVLIRPDLVGALYNLAIITFERGAFRDSETYLVRYMRLTNPSLDSLILGVKIARANGDKASEDSFLQQLRRRFPDAPQLRELTEGSR